MKFVPEQKILYLKQLTVGRIFPLSMPLLIVSKMHLAKANLCAGFLLSSRKLLVCLGINQQKSALKSIRYRNNDWNMV